MKNVESKKMDEELNKLEDMGSKSKDAKKRSYTYDAKTYIELTTISSTNGTRSIFLTFLMFFNTQTMKHMSTSC